MAWYLLFYLRGVRLLILALKASNVEACGISVGKLLHVVNCSLKKAVFMYLQCMLVWYGWKPRGYYVLEAPNWDGMALQFCKAWSASKYFSFLVMSANLLNLACWSRCWCYGNGLGSIWQPDVVQIQASMLPPWVYGSQTQVLYSRVGLTSA